MLKKDKPEKTNTRDKKTIGDTKFQDRGKLIERNYSQEVKRRKCNIIVSRLKRKVLSHIKILRAVGLVLTLVFFWVILSTVGRLLKTTTLGTYAGFIYDFIALPENKISSIGGETNILLLGKGGNGHDAPDLTDTIVFVSISLTDNRISFISIPRDIWIPELRAKINSIYYWGNKKRDGGGLLLAKSQVEEIVGRPIQYAAVLDFSGFKKIVDVLGGVEVDVENSFIDTKYPIPGKENDDCGGDPQFVCRYEILRFDKGVQYMNGETALKFVRSRNAEGDEGTDFARAKRQQKVILAIENKILSRRVILSPETILALKDVILSSVETDLNLSASAVVLRKLLDSRRNSTSYVIPEEYLSNPPKSPEYDNLYVFIPKSGDWKDVRRWVECKLLNKDCKFS